MMTGLDVTLWSLPPPIHSLLIFLYVFFILPRLVFCVPCFCSNCVDGIVLIVLVRVCVECHLCHGVVQ